MSPKDNILLNLNNEVSIMFHEGRKIISEQTKVLRDMLDSFLHVPNIHLKNV